MKNSLTPAGIEPATLGFSAQYLDHCATAVPQIAKVNLLKKLTHTLYWDSKPKSKYSTHTIQLSTYSTNMLEQYLYAQQQFYTNCDLRQ